jgi:ubiquinol-cytochrome c reductase iron-sulfur subunit
MSTSGVDKGRRRFITAATTVVGAVGTGFVVAPFVISMQPSARAQAAGAPVEADISKLEPGQMMTVEWRGKPVWIVRRTEQNLADLSSIEGRLLDVASDNTKQQPSWAKNQHRSLKPEYLVLVGICTHLGCSPTYRPDIAPADLGADWRGGFFCPCHGSLFDLSGRVYTNVPAPSNLEVPPYKYLSDSLIVVGEDGGTA